MSLAYIRKFVKKYFLTKAISPFFLILLITFPKQLLFADEVRPRVIETEGWNKIKANDLTGFPEDNRENVWKKAGKNDSKGRSGPITVVIKTDEQNRATVWADKLGVHFFDKANGDIKTPFDFSKLDYRFGPIINYSIMTDYSFSYFLVRWHEVQKTPKSIQSFAYIGMTNSDGEILWKKDTKLSENKFVTNEKISPRGDALIEVGDGDQDEQYGEVQIWDKNGKEIGNLPKYATDYFWSKDGANIHYTHYSVWPPKSGVAPIINVGIYDREGNLVSDNK